MLEINSNESSAYNYFTLKNVVKGAVVLGGVAFLATRVFEEGRRYDGSVLDFAGTILVLGGMLVGRMLIDRYIASRLPRNLDEVQGLLQHLSQS